MFQNHTVMIASDYNRLVTRWKRLIDTVEKVEFEATFLDKIHLLMDDDEPSKTIDVKHLKALNFYDTLDELEYVIDTAIRQQDNIFHIDVIVDTEAVMGIAIPAVENYLKSFDK